MNESLEESFLREWETVRPKLELYLQSYGIFSGKKLSELCSQISLSLREQYLQKLQFSDKALLAPNVNVFSTNTLTGAAIQEAIRLIDAWLQPALPVEQNPLLTGEQIKCRARASLFGLRSHKLSNGESFEDFFLTQTSAPEELIPIIRKACETTNTPAPHTLTMEPQKLFFHKPLVDLRRSAFVVATKFLRLFRSNS